MNDRERLGSLGIAYPECGFWVEEGWRPLVYGTLERLIEAGWDRRLAQVKEKFCVLTIYLDSHVSEPLRAILQEAARESEVICERCGGPRERKGASFGRAYCGKCLLEPL